MSSEGCLGSVIIHIYINISLSNASFRVLSSSIFCCLILIVILYKAAYWYTVIISHRLIICFWSQLFWRVGWSVSVYVYTYVRMVGNTICFTFFFSFLLDFFFTDLWFAECVLLIYNEVYHTPIYFCCADFDKKCTCKQFWSGWDVKSLGVSTWLELW